MSRTGDLEHRIDAVAEDAAKLDTLVLGTLGDSVRGLIETARKEEQDKVTAIAMESLRTVLEPFPAETRSLVAGAIQNRVDDITADDKARRVYNASRRWGAPEYKTANPPLPLMELFGLEEKRK